MLVIMIITSTPCQQGLSAECLQQRAFTKHRPCLQGEQDYREMFNTLKNKCFNFNGGEKMR